MQFGPRNISIQAAIGNSVASVAVTEPRSVKKPEFAQGGLPLYLWVSRPEFETEPNNVPGSIPSSPDQKPFASSEEEHGPPPELTFRVSPLYVSMSLPLFLTPWDSGRHLAVVRFNNSCFLGHASRDYVEKILKSFPSLSQELILLYQLDAAVGAVPRDHFQINHWERHRVECSGGTLTP